MITTVSNPSPTETRTIRQRVHDVRLRPIRPDDWRRLQRFHQRLSGETVERRFHAAKRELSTPLAHRFTQLDGRDSVGVVATTGTRGRIVGVARYNRISPTAAEVAFVVEDAYQGHGLGRRLMRRLCQIARENGITQYVAEILPGNTGMLRLLQEVGPVRTRYFGGVCEVWVDLPCAKDSPSVLVQGELNPADAPR